MRRTVLTALVVAGAAAGGAHAAVPWRTLSDSGGGFSIALPAGWQVVPRSTPALHALVSQLSRRRQTALASEYAEVAALRRTTHTVYRVQAFAWPAPAGDIVPDVTVKVDTLRRGTTPTALPLIARAVEQALSRAKKTTVSKPVGRRIPAGPTVEIAGTTRLSKTLRSRYAVYLLVHGGRLYSISFRGTPPDAVEARILASFRFS